MEILGMSIAEFVAVLGSAVALTITIIRAGKPDVQTESVQHLLEPLNQEIHELRAELIQKEQAHEAYKLRNRAWKATTSKKISFLVKELGDLKKDMEEE